MISDFNLYYFSRYVKLKKKNQTSYLIIFVGNVICICSVTKTDGLTLLIHSFTGAKYIICDSTVDSGVPRIKVDGLIGNPIAVWQTQFQTRNPDKPVRRWI